MIKKANWIAPDKDFGKVSPFFERKFSLAKKVEKAEIEISCIGVYNAYLNGQRIGKYILAPGWTEYTTRLQYQTFDITGLLKKNNTLRVDLAPGWYHSRIHDWGASDEFPAQDKPPISLIASVTITYTDGTVDTINTDRSWKCGKTPLLFCDIYDGFTYDAAKRAIANCNVKTLPHQSKKILIKQQGEEIREQEIVFPVSYFTTPKGEKVIDFGQNLTGYLQFSVLAKRGDRVKFSHAEVLDADGNFYNANYRSAAANYEYICRDGEQTFKPDFTFFGFRYIRIDEYPAEIDLDNFKAIVVYSNIKKTGELNSSDPLLNKLFSNIFWGQKGNYLDIPTDCPQRDERLGWTGDAQVFVRTASYNYDVEKFFDKWMADITAEQKRLGYVPHVVPATPCFEHGRCSSAWSDVAVIAPWQIYLSYGNKKLLARQFWGMCQFVDHIGTITTKKDLWFGCDHYGDWLGLDAKPGDYVGASDKDFIATAYYAYSTSLVVKAGRALGRNISEYEALYNRIVKAFRKQFPEYKTQTEHVLALYFNLCEDKAATAKSLADMIIANGTRLQTGFVGTPYILHALSENGYTDLAYDLLLQKQFPSWLFSVLQGATTMWEHWDGKNEKGEFWSADMNSFNHYAYGAVADWVYGVACGIQTVDEAPGFKKIVIAPHATDKLESLSASIKTRQGLVSSKWFHTEGRVRYEIETPSDTTVIIEGKAYHLGAGKYVF
jgi:alpha-L-rhamnosidase